ncbi:hypothetical protein CPC16_002111 [Podila verticillata]|nr:hypothetical protein CPC16_002111 [Podila verticillata]KAI9236135.1 MAG: hypothetical protein BYD32DRAFT_419458 [Podila humilis]
MRITAFAPAIFALGLFATTQALPTPAEQNTAVELLKRGSLVNAVVDLFVDANVKAHAEVLAKVHADACLDVNLDLHVDASVLGGIITADVDTKLRTSVRAEVDAWIATVVDAHLSAVVDRTHIEAHVNGVIAELCHHEDRDCIHDNAHLIVANVIAHIKADIEIVVKDVKADIEAHLRLRLNVIIHELCIHLGIVEAKVTSKLHIASNVNAHVAVLVKACVDIYAKVDLEAHITAL